jgi:hypothetical protein
VTGRPVRVLAFLVALLVAGCDDAPPSSPSRALTLAFADPVLARLVAGDDAAAVYAVAEFDVVVGDPLGPGGVVRSVETRIVNRSRTTEVARNARPNSDFAYPNTAVPAGGSLTLPAGVVYPLPPPRDDVQVVVTVMLTDGRRVEQAARVVPG